jgi:hypothetical protein
VAEIKEMTGKVADPVSSVLWRHMYAKLFAHVLYEQIPEAREAYMNAISDLLELRRTRKERHARSR